MAIYWRTRRGETTTDYRLVNDEMVSWEVPATTPELFGDQLATCTFCGRPEASGYWRGVEDDVAVCRGCAVEVLPKLLADALVGERGDNPQTTGQLHRKLETVLKNFWQAVAGAVWSAVRCLRRSEARVKGIRL
jgi:hypothetical protein